MPVGDIGIVASVLGYGGGIALSLGIGRAYAFYGYTDTLTIGQEDRNVRAVIAAAKQSAQGGAGASCSTRSGGDACSQVEEAG